MRILILGGDGYLGWPTAMRFSDAGHEVSVVDNFSRRRWHTELSTDSLTPIASLADRIEAWREKSGNEIHPFVGSIEDFGFLDAVDRGDAAGGDRPLRRAAVGALLDEVARGRRRDAVHERDRQPQPAVLDPRPRPRLPPRQARDDGRVRDARTSTSRRGSSRSSTTAARTRCRSRSCRARSTTSRRSTTRTTSTSPAGSGACGRPTSTRASSTGSRPRSRPATSGSSPASTTTSTSAPSSTASASRR